MSGESPDEGRSAWAEKRPKRSEGKNGEPLADNLAEIDSCRPDRSLADVLDYLLADADTSLAMRYTSDFQKQTEVTSHELAEALTNPAHGGWYDSNPSDYLPNGNEIGDIANLDWTYLDGYVVQREWSHNFSRDIAPLLETWGYVCPYWYITGGTSTSNGQSGPGYRQGYVLWGPAAQYEWFLPDGSSSGWFVPD